MKRFKKLVAVLLACVMALTLLTACGGGGGGSSAIFNFSAQQLTDNINKRLNSNLVYDENLGPRFATAINAAVSAGQKYDDIEEAAAAMDIILTAAGFGEDAEVAVTVAQKGASLDLVASGLVNSINEEKYTVKDKKIGYATSKLNIDGNYYAVFAILSKS